MSHRRVLLIALTGLALADPAFAAEPYLEFVRGLRERGYYDVAEQYLDSLAKQPNVPRDVQELLPYERAVTLRDAARRLLDPDEQRIRFAAALAAFDEFAKASPNHPLAGTANSERAAMLIDQARVDLGDAAGSSDPAAQNTLRENARKQILAARQLFQTAAAQHQQRFQSFPLYIAEQDKDRKAARDLAQAEHIQTQLDYAQTLYWEAQTWPTGNPRRNEALQQALEEFRKITTNYRMQVGGLTAHLWEGKCLEETGAIKDAIAIYADLLKNDPAGPAMLNLLAQAKQFQLICYNRDDQKEYRLVTQMAAQWLQADQNRKLKNTPVGQAIEWEQARALEQLGQDKTLPEAERNGSLNQALTIARGLSRRTGSLKAQAAAMAARLNRALGRDKEDPRDFSTAYGRADDLFQQAQQINEKIAAAQAAGKQEEVRQQTASLKGTAAELTRVLSIGLKYVTAATDETLRLRAELMLAVGYVYQQRQLDAAVLGEYFLRNYTQAPPEMIRLAGEIALSALNDAYQAAGSGPRDFERQHILRLTDLLGTRWPGSDIASSAHFSAARLFWDEGDFLRAAERWERVPESASSFGPAQLKAGSAYLEQYGRSSQLPADERPTSDDLSKWRDAAETHLQRGVDVESERTAAAARNDDLIRGKLALAQVRNLAGDYSATGAKPGAVELLTSPPHAVIDAINVDTGAARPTDAADVRSAPFASAAYQQLLRAYIGLRDIDKAREARLELEEVGAGEGSGALTQVFVAFGQQLQQELEQLQASGDVARVAEVRAAFEAFLADLYGRDEKQQTFSSLLWIAETYASLGEGSTDSPQKSRQYFERAANAYQRIIDRAAADPAFSGSPQNTLAVKLRLVVGRVRQKDFPAAEQALLDVLKESPNAPNVQADAARLYQEWGAGGQPEKLEIALRGTQTPAAIWGWGELARRMRDQRNRPELRSIYYDATYCSAETFQQYAGTKSGEARTKALQDARYVLETFVRTNRDVSPETMERMGGLYRQVLAGLGEPEADLARVAVSGAPVRTATPAAASPVAAATPTETAVAPAATSDDHSPSMTRSYNPVLLGGLVLAGIAAVAGLFFWNAARTRKQRSARLAALTAAARQEQPGPPARTR